jgi:preprotein translocase subunit YajC
MIDWMTGSTFLAQAAEAAQPAPDAAQAPGTSPLVTLAPLMFVFALFYFLMIRPQQKERKKRDSLLQELKKNDKVVTIGGLIGTVADLSGDGQEVTLKLDDSIRVKILRSSINGFYTKEAAEKS